MKNFSDRLNFILKNKGLKNADLARLTGIFSGTISKILRNERKPGIETIEKIVDALELKPAETQWLIKGKNLSDLEALTLIEEAKEKDPETKKFLETFDKALGGNQEAIDTFKFMVNSLEKKWKK